MRGHAYGQGTWPALGMGSLLANEQGDAFSLAKGGEARPCLLGWQTLTLPMDEQNLALFAIPHPPSPPVPFAFLPYFRLFEANFALKVKTTWYPPQCLVDLIDLSFECDSISCELGGSPHLLVKFVVESEDIASSSASLLIQSPDDAS